MKGQSTTAVAGSKKNTIAGKIRTANRGYFDYSHLMVIVFLCVFGLIMVYSSSYYTARVTSGDQFLYVRRQAIAFAIGFAAMLVVSHIDYHFFRKLAIPAFVLALVLMLLVNYTPFGIEYNGQKRWFGIAGHSLFQAAEAVKLAIIVSVPALVTKLAGKIDTIRAQLLVVAVHIPVIYLVLDNNLSSGIIIFGMVCAVIFIASKKRLRFFVLIALAVAAVVFVYYNIDTIVELGILEEYQAQRIYVWQDPSSYSTTGAYQVLQGLYAIGSGGFFGKGLGQSLQKLDFVPEVQNDMIFTIICEELGVFGAICVILLFLYLLWRLMVIANNAPDLFGALMVVCIMAQIALQVIFNIAVVTNTIPNTGITLPFISYGGTSVVFLLIEMGIALSVARSIGTEASKT